MQGGSKTGVDTLKGTFLPWRILDYIVVANYSKGSSAYENTLQKIIVLFSKTLLLKQDVEARIQKLLLLNIAKSSYENLDESLCSFYNTYNSFSVSNLSTAKFDSRSPLIWMHLTQFPNAESAERRLFGSWLEASSLSLKFDSGSLLVWMHLTQFPNADSAERRRFGSWVEASQFKIWNSFSCRFRGRTGLQQPSKRHQGKIWACWVSISRSRSRWWVIQAFSNIWGRHPSSGWNRIAFTQRSPDRKVS